MKRDLQVGDKVICTNPDVYAISFLKTGTGIVTETSGQSVNVCWADGRSLSMNPNHLRVTHAATYRQVYDFAAGQVWQSAEGDYFFVASDGCGDTHLTDTMSVRYDTDAIDSHGPFTLVFDPLIER